jgi:hypothetical protein
MSVQTMTRGDTLVIKLVVRDSITGAVMPVPGWTFWFTVKRFASDPDEYAVFAAKTGDGSGGIVVTDVNLGALTVTMPASKTRLFPDTPTKLLYDVQAMDATGVVSTIDSGTILIDPTSDITRAVS